MGEPQKEMEDMEGVPTVPIWTIHESRISNLELTVSDLKVEMRSLQTDVKEVKEIVQKGNDDSSNKLDEINDKLFNEFFKKEQDKRLTKREITLAVFGTGGGLYAIFETITKLL